MRKWLNWIGLGLMAAAAAAMIAGDALAGEPSQPWAPTAEKFYLQFDLLAPADISCDASGPGVRVKATRNLVGKPVLRLTGNVSDAEISCWRPDGSRYVTRANRALPYNSAEPVRATVSFDAARDAMTVVLRRGDQDRIARVLPRAFVRVQ
ncbi:MULTISPECIES: hypothetical protein [unclassified Paracoccus (in: a-proteobacteria)]|uniref:hypothetical protein n=1 Tax=unclassified Paracoccus (in: a-proteobacteria) TaxID=2688777 RepID=UPI001E29F41C|nr:MULTISPECIES: hypothetical protein [unclassified Paracoccus (in: a-proteobacteria)]UXU75211.1 hypothetical protein GB879_001535 [Paracoccus sp. SMMA_5]UXU81113.1 hypothetical protein GB880_001530 [Paracoccus sp. SMMA_5_TC]